MTSALDYKVWKLQTVMAPARTRESDAKKLRRLSRNATRDYNAKLDPLERPVELAQVHCVLESICERGRSCRQAKKQILRFSRADLMRAFEDSCPADGNSGKTRQQSPTTKHRKQRSRKKRKKVPQIQISERKPLQSETQASFSPVTVSIEARAASVPPASHVTPLDDLDATPLDVAPESPPLHADETSKDAPMSIPSADDAIEEQAVALATEVDIPTSAMEVLQITPECSISKARKQGPKQSPYFSPSPSAKSPRKIKDITSCLPFPPLSAKSFGLIQEQMAGDAHKLLVAVKLLNKTAGRAAVPVFFELIARYPTAESLAVANQDDVVDVIRSLGLQNTRARTIIEMSRQWVHDPPRKGVRYRTMGYPAEMDGRDIGSKEILDDDDPRIGAWEIAHLKGLGEYAIDSWRIFCRDEFRGLAASYNGEGAVALDFEPEWKRVVPRDKELRAYLRWRWLREGWLWDPTSGSRTPASEALMAKAEHGDIAVADFGAASEMLTLTPDVAAQLDRTSQLIEARPVESTCPIDALINDKVINADNDRLIVNGARPLAEVAGQQQSSNAALDRRNSRNEPHAPVRKSPRRTRRGAGDFSPLRRLSCGCLTREELVAIPESPLPTACGIAVVITTPKK